MKTNSSTPLILLTTVTLLIAPAFAQEKTPLSSIDYPAFNQISQEAYVYRKDRRVPITRFIKMANEKETLILETRSTSAYRKKHLKGSVHLHFSDFTAE